MHSSGMALRLLLPRPSGRGDRFLLGPFEFLCWEKQEKEKRYRERKRERESAGCGPTVGGVFMAAPRVTFPLGLISPYGLRAGRFGIRECVLNGEGVNEARAPSPPRFL